MRAITGQENAVLNAADGHAVHVRVWVWDGAAYQNVSALEGRNWLVSAEWDESIDEPCAQATVTLRRRLEDFSLNPLVSNKLTGLLALARPFIIEAATVPLGDPAQESDFREVFYGKVETLAMDKDPLVFTGRDAAGDLSRAFIEEEREYGSDAGTAVESIIQSILTDNGTGVTLYVRNVSGGTTTGAVFGRFKQKKASVLAAVRELALKIGWDLRYIWDDTSSTWRFTLIEPDRTATASDWTFQPHKVKNVTKLSQTLFDVRNTGRLYYYNRSAADAAGVAPLAYVTAEDAASIAAYQRQYIQFAEPEDSPVDSASEAQTMLNAAIADLKDPLLDFGVEVGFFFPVQLGDMLTFAADELHFTSAQTLAVVKAAHRIDARGHRTRLELRGKPAGANDEWLKRDSRVRKLSQPPASAPDPVSGLTATATAGGAVVSFTAPVTPPLPVEFELHLSTASGFTPSLSTLREKAARTTFELSGLTSGATYYAQVVGRDKVGNRSAAVEVSFTTRYVEPRTLQPHITYALLPVNGEFEAYNDTSRPPDGWELTGGTWGVNVVSDTGTYYSGKRAVLLGSGSGAARMLSSPFVVRPGDTLLATAAIALNAPEDTSRLVSLAVQWLGADFAVLSSTTVGQTYSTANDLEWQVVGSNGRATAPATARYARLSVGKDGAGSYLLVLDSVRLFVLPASERWRSPSPNTASGWGNASGKTATKYRRQADGTVRLAGYFSSPAAVTATDYAFILDSGCRPGHEGDYTCTGGSTGGAFASIRIKPNGEVHLLSGASPICFDGVTFVAEN